jgi:hypothetical protein
MDRPETALHRPRTRSADSLRRQPVNLLLEAPVLFDEVADKLFEGGPDIW